MVKHDFCNSVSKRISLVLILMTALSLGAEGQGQVGSAGGSSSQPRLVAQLGHSQLITSVAFSRDGRYVLTGSQDSTARLWEAETGREVRKFEGGSGGVNSVAFSPDGRYVLAGNSDKTAWLWEAESGREALRFAGHSHWVLSVAFSRDGRYVLTGSADNGKENHWSTRSRFNNRRCLISPEAEEKLCWLNNSQTSRRLLKLG